jgi:hypothetical protein
MAAWGWGGLREKGGSPSLGGGCVNDTTSSRSGAEAYHCFSLSLARSATVSVDSVNIGGDSDQPMGNTRGKPMSFYSPSRAGKRTPSLGTHFARMQIQ